MRAAPRLALLALLLLPLQAAALEFAELDRGRGLMLFRNYCIACHGPDGTGSVLARADLEPDPPVLLARPDATPGQYFWQIHDGSRQMPHMYDELSDRDIWNIVYALPLIRWRQHEEWHPDKFGHWQRKVARAPKGG